MSWSVAIILYHEFNIVICIDLWHDGIVTPLLSILYIIDLSYLNSQNIDLTLTKNYSSSSYEKSQRSFNKFPYVLAQKTPYSP